jgi:enamine deaminase RidA (YjgF/YER057c/UK114 family)
LLQEPGTGGRVTASPEVRLRELGIDLARTLHRPKGSYDNVLTVGELVYVSGHGPLIDGTPAYVGRVPSEVGVADAYEAARLTARNCLSTLEDHLGSLDRIERIVKLFGMVRADPDFEGHPGVIDGASDLLVEVFGERGRHTRSAVGMQSLPFGISVEIELVAAIAPSR